jgi:hypothetical protein
MLLGKHWQLFVALLIELCNLGVESRFSILLAFGSVIQSTALLRPNNAFWTVTGWDGMLPRVTLQPSRYASDVRKVAIIVRVAKPGNLLLGNLFSRGRGGFSRYVLPVVVTVVIYQFFRFCVAVLGRPRAWRRHATFRATIRHVFGRR